jgi:Spy/CpxP family protein refolding chaperone
MRTFCTIGILLLTVSAAVAQNQPHEPQPDPFAGNLFPPELIMQNQQALGLSEEQKNFIKDELRKTPGLLTDVQFDLPKEMEKLVALMKQVPVDEAQTLTQLDKVLELERKIKRTHVGLLIRLKNNLKPEQQTKLREIARKMKEDK